jgi:hypothetical protein
MSCLFINFQCEEIMKNETTLITADRIDTLGNLLADIKVLTAKADAIKDDLKDVANLSGDRTFEGDAFKALYIESNVSTVDWKSLAKELGISADIIAKHTKTAARFSVKVEAK